MLKLKVLGTCVGAIALTVLVVAAAILLQRGRLGEQLREEFGRQAVAECEHAAQNVYSLVKAQYEAEKRRLSSDLNVARHALRSRGEVGFSDEMAQWAAVNQYTKDVRKIALPRMLVGGTWLGQLMDFEHEAPVVDEVQSLVGGTCTIFQRMNEAGDMLRVCTNVKKLDGSRAVGTYIPAVNPDGKPNPVIQTVLAGETFLGRAYVVNDWYNTAYEPIRDKSGKVVGVLYVGIKQAEIRTVHEAIESIQVGETGYVFVLGGTGDQRGDYIVSKGGKRDGECIIDAKDANGNLFIVDMLEKALGTKDGSCALQRYDWKNPSDPHARTKLAAVTYFAPWDWVIGAGSYEDEFQGAQMRVVGALNELVSWVCVVGLGALVLCGAAVWFVVKRLIRPVDRAVEMLKDIAEGEGDLTKRLDASSGDELGELAGWFNRFVDKIEAIIAQIARNAECLAMSAERLSGTSAGLAGGRSRCATSRRLWRHRRTRCRGT